MLWHAGLGRACTGHGRGVARRAVAVWRARTWNAVRRIGMQTATERISQPSTASPAAWSSRSFEPSLGANDSKAMPAAEMAATSRPTRGSVSTCPWRARTPAAAGLSDQSAADRTLLVQRVYGSIWV